MVLLLVTAPWLLGRGVTAGALVGALAYLTQSLLPALQHLMHGLGAAGTRLAVVLRRLTLPGRLRARRHAPRPARRRRRRPCMLRGLPQAVIDTAPAKTARARSRPASAALELS